MKKCFYTSNGNYNCNNIENFENLQNIEFVTKNLVNDLGSLKDNCEVSIEKASQELNQILNKAKQNCSSSKYLVDKSDNNANLAIDYMININNLDNSLTSEKKRNLKDKLLKSWIPNISKCNSICYSQDELLKSKVNNQKPNFDVSNTQICKNTKVNVSFLKKENNNFTLPEYEYSCFDFLNIENPN